MKKRVDRRKYHLIILVVIFIFVFLVSPLFKFLIQEEEPVLFSPMTLTGKSEVVITDKNDGSSYIKYYLHTNNEIYEIIDYLNSPKIPEDSVSGEDIEVSGEVNYNFRLIILNQSSIFNRLTKVDNVNVAAIQQRGNFNLGEQKTLVVPIYLSEETPPTTTLQDINNSVFNLNNPNSLNSWIKEVSYNKAWLTGQVTDWVPVTSTSYDCVPNKMRELIPVSINIEPYTRLIIVFADEMCSSQIDGIANIGIPEVSHDDTKIWISTSLIMGADGLNNGVINHEFGHNLGLLHANVWWCENMPPSQGPCSSSEYSDPVDVMGDTSNKTHFNSLHKEKIGWLKESQIQNYNPKQGNFTLEPIETPNGIKMIKIPLADGTFYSIEYRRPIGLDTNVFNNNYGSLGYEGARIHWLKNDNQGDTQLLDLTTIVEQEIGGGKYTAVLLPDETFQDTANGITITTLEATPEYLKVNISGGIHCAPGDILNPDQISCTTIIESEPEDAYLEVNGSGDFNILRNEGNIDKISYSDRSDGLKVDSSISPFYEYISGNWITGTGTTLSRAFLSFNTRSIPKNSVINFATLSISPTFSYQYSNEQNYNFVTLINANPLNPPNITKSDFNKLIPSPTNAAEIVDSNYRYYLDSSSNFYFPLNNLGLSSINKTNFTTFALITGRDLIGGIQDDKEINKLSFASSNRKSVQYHPKLTINYAPSSQSVCGNGAVEQGEQCDDMGNNNNLDQCTSDCSLTYCGDGITQRPNGRGIGGLLNYGYEECDSQPGCSSNCVMENNPIICSSESRCGQYSTETDCLLDECEFSLDCTWYDNSCHNPTCGDGLKTAGEFCEINIPASCMTLEGYHGQGQCNLQCTNIHANTCASSQFCGDSIINGEEICDDGNNNGQPNYCNLECTGLTPGSCGNNIIETGEQCDDGNQKNGDNCIYKNSANQLCVNNICGDGYFNPNKEECDDGNTVDDDFCSNNCKINFTLWGGLYTVKIPANPLDGVLSIYQPPSSNPNLDFDDFRNGIGNMKKFQDNTYQHIENSHLTNGYTHRYHLTRAIFSFNTSILPSSLNIDYSTLDLNGNVQGMEQGNYINLVKVSLINPPDFYFQDFHNFGAETINRWDVQETGAHQISISAFDNGGNSLINKTGWTNLGLIGNYDIQGLPDSNQRILQVLIFQSDYQRTSDAPYPPQLTIYFTAGCGNGYYPEGDEECDDGNYEDGDGCSSTCQIEISSVCGNEDIEEGEECDDGNENNNDACTNQCKNNVCGDNYVNPITELCDDGNTQNGDKCSSNCLCSDTDGGLNNGVKGTVRVFGDLTSNSDVCVSRGIVKEYYCTNNGAKKYQDITCPQGTMCTNGMCYGGDTCFLPDTLIKTNNGDKMIKDVKEGELVMSYNEKNDKYEYGKVTKTFEHNTNGYLIINNKLKVTPNHPMHINGEWKEIGDAKLGDKIKTFTGEETIFSIKEVNKNVDVYNLEVEGNHNYVAEGYLAHNKGPLPPNIGIN